MRCSLRLSLALAIAGAIGGCGVPIPSTDLPPVREVMPATEFPELRDYRGIVDLKTAGVDQSALAEIAKPAQIDFITLANPVKPGSADFGIGGYSSELLVIPGGAFEANGGEIVGMNLIRPIDPKLAPTSIIAAIHARGGLAIAANLGKFRSPQDYALADAIEVYNQHDVWDAQNRNLLYLNAIFLGADHFFSDLDLRPTENFAVYDRFVASAHATLLAGFGSPEDFPVFGMKTGTFQQWFLVYTTHVLATERAIDPVVDAIRHGRVYVSFDLLGYVPTFAFYAQNGATKTIMGDEVALSPGLALKAELPAAADEISLYKDGAAIKTIQGASTLEFVPQSAGTYRIEAYRGGHMWILSNPIYLR
ncbi:MAG TPA: hypothetical protein VMU16_01390 [Candidatus Binataceae bacterium]|nr:hypothetical protein [Candidatus Binataceae bacterium]